MADIWELLKQLLAGQQQPVDPQVQNLAQHGFRGAQQMVQQSPRQGGLLGALGSPALQMGLGIPLAGFGAYELARGRPGGALLGTLGGLGTYFGEQGLAEQKEKLQAQKSFAQQLKVAKQQFPLSKGLEQTITGLAGVDPDAAIKQLDQLTKYNEELSKAHKAAQKVIMIGGNPFKQDISGNLLPVPLPKGMKEWPRKEDEKLPANLVLQIMHEHGIKGEPTGAQWKDILDEADQRINKRQLTGAAGRAAIETAQVAPRTEIRESIEAKYHPKPIKVPTKSGYDGAPSDSGIIIYTPKPPTGTGASAAIGSALGITPPKRSFATLPGKPGKKYYKGDFIPGKGYWDGED